VTTYSSIPAAQLISACALSNDPVAWEEFVHRFQRPISIAILRIAHQCGAASGDVVDDLVQETYLKLCANKCHRLLDFATEHPDAVIGYIKTVAVNVAHDHFKAMNSRKRGSGQTFQFLEELEPRGPLDAPGGQSAMEREALLREINDCLELCSTGDDLQRDRLIFWLYYQQGMTAKAIAGLPRIELTVKGVESAINRLIRLVRERLVGRLETTTSSIGQYREKGL
jgi:RNA polymerase sigma-70 factor (ECF subfamily)